MNKVLAFTLLSVIPYLGLASPVPVEKRLTPASWSSGTTYGDLNGFLNAFSGTVQYNSQYASIVKVGSLPEKRDFIPPLPLGDGQDLSEREVLGAGDDALAVLLKAGLWNPASGGGFGFYGHPIELGGAHSVTLDYYVYFPAGFDWVKGGKLPGLYGGHKSCTGGAAATDCFSTRFMWRTSGQGELYLYADRDAQSSSFCSQVVGGTCQVTDGMSLERGSFSFQTGTWNHLSQTIVMNTIGSQNGQFTLSLNGAQVASMNNVVYSTASSVSFIGLDAEVFFGGSDDTWAPSKDQHVYLTKFTITVNS